MVNDASTPKAKLLIVDDQEINLRMVSGILRNLGFGVFVAHDGDQARAVLKEHEIDLILLDVLMPGQDGFAVCRQIRAHPAWTDIPVIFLSAADDKDLIVRALEAGGVDYVTKPFNHAELVSRVNTHVALKAARDQLKRLAEDKDELLGILAHDLKNHLGGIKLSAHVLHANLQKLKDSESVGLAANIHAGTDQMFAFVVEFLANSASDRGMVFKPEPVWLDEISTAATAHYAETARRKHIRLTHSGKVSDPTRIDLTAVNQILHNLISNAVKFSPVGTSVHVSVETGGGGGAVWRVKDAGPGFSAHDRTQMFRRYQRLSARPTAEEPSSGLGLSIVKRLVDGVGAELECESGSSGGTTFTLRFPAFALEGAEAFARVDTINPKAITRAAE